jgi:protein-tyrosine phosphatase
MIDLHCHLLPGIDDGPKTIDMSLEMARLAAADGITTIACTPHILPGVYNNTGPGILTAIADLQEALNQALIQIRLVAGADVHVAPDLAAQLQDGRALTLNKSRYFLLEPPQHVLPPGLADYIFGLQVAGYVPIITHPERLSWVENHYDLVKRLVDTGSLMQLTAGALTGRFGRRPRHLAERMLDDGLCHVVASDGHNTDRRRPCLSEARELLARRLGEEEATKLVLTRPRAILDDVAPSLLPPPPARKPAAAPSTWTTFLKRRRADGP